MNPEMALRLPSPDPGKWMSGVLAVVVHVLLAAMLFFGVHWQTQPATPIAVELYSAPPPVVQPVVPPQPETPAPPPKVEPKPEPPVAKPDIAVKAPEKPKAKPEPKPEPKKPAQPAAPDWSRELQATQQSLDRSKATQQADRELKDLQAAQASAARRRGEQEWVAKVGAKIRGNVVLPPNISGNPESRYSISQLPDGSVLNVIVKKSSGNPLLDSAVERAIRKSSPLPLPNDRSITPREFEISYRPVEN